MFTFSASAPRSKPLPMGGDGHGGLDGALHMFGTKLGGIDSNTPEAASGGDAMARNAGLSPTAAHLHELAVDLVRARARRPRRS